MVSALLLVLLSVAALSVPVVQAQYSPANVVNAHPTKDELPEDCNDHFKNGSTHSGMYTIYPRGYNKAVRVYCEMDCEDVAYRQGWTVIQRRMDGTVNFYRPWSHYKEGFGNISGEHWLGLDHIFAISWQKRYMLTVDMEDFEGGSVHTSYDLFSIARESDGYKLHLGKYIDGGAGNSMAYSNGLQFSTFDHGPYRYYAERYHGGFWFNSYPYANPNGLYRWGRHSQYRSGVLWTHWKSYYSLKSITMKIKPLSLGYQRMMELANPLHG